MVLRKSRTLPGARLVVTGFIFDKHSVVRGPQRELFDITPLQVPTPFLEHHGDEAIFRAMNAQDVLLP
jgi:hypothetical protein